MIIKSQRKQIKFEVIPYEKCPAKTINRDDGITLGVSTPEHCIIVGKVAREIIKQGFPGKQANMFPEYCELVAALHDVGKISPTFSKKILSACTVPPKEYLCNLKDIDYKIEHEWGGHAGVSQIELENQLKDINPFSKTPMIVGQHHGFLPNVDGSRYSSPKFGGEPWHEERVKCIKKVAEDLGLDPIQLPDVKDPLTARLISGLTTVADWIGSSCAFVEDHDHGEEKIYKVVQNAGLGRAKIRTGLSFKDIFEFEPNETQANFLNMVKGPGVYVLEAPMGLGKTEAALYASYLSLCSSDARGIYFALPTQLTSNKMHARLASFLEKILPEKRLTNPILLHGSAWVSQSLEMGEDAAPGGSWFLQGKKGILAPFAVGTVDQALLAVMNVKHGFVRSFGLAGKVVILDEVHSYDAYTGSILAALIETLKALRCTVIILSATLTSEQKKILLKKTPSRNDYPLGTAIYENSIETTAEAALLTSEPKQKRHKIKKTSDRNIAVEEAIKKAQDGQQVLWIENTVQGAQSTYLLLRAALEQSDVECGLIHSRFTSHDREINETKWVQIYGKNGSSERTKRGRVLVGTQVLEQSIDIDADFLVTEICPTDMLLQRLGRHWRHDDTQRPPGATCDAWIIVPEELSLKKNIKDAFGMTSLVYASYVLMRTMQAWEEVDEIYLPRDIRSIIEATYKQRTESERQMQVLFKELEEGEYRWGKKIKPGRRALENLSRTTLTEMGARASDERPLTRYSDMPTAGVILLKKCELRKKGAPNLTFACGNAAQICQKNLKEVGVLVERNTINMAAHMAPKPLTMGVARELGLHRVAFAGEKDAQNNQESRLRVAILQPAFELKNPWSAEPIDAMYRPDLGYWKEKKENNAIF